VTGTRYSGISCRGLYSGWVQLVWSELIGQALSAYCPCVTPG
jgi:hypothetical protein